MLRGELRFPSCFEPLPRAREQSVARKSVRAQLGIGKEKQFETELAMYIFPLSKQLTIRLLS